MRVQSTTLLVRTCCLMAICGAGLILHRDGDGIGEPAYRAAAADITAVGGQIRVNHRGESDRTQPAPMPGNRCPAGGLKEFASLRKLNLRGVTGPRVEITDDGLADLVGLHRSRVLNLSVSRLHGPGLRSLKRFPNPKALALDPTRLTPASPDAE